MEKVYCDGTGSTAVKQSRQLYFTILSRLKTIERINNMQQANVYQQYKAQSLETLTNGEIVVKLFEEASKQISMGIFLINNDNSYKAYNSISKAHKVISTLNSSLDMAYAISLELREMYLFIEQKLIQANGARDIALLKEILSLVDDLKITFRQSEKLARSQR